VFSYKRKRKPQLNGAVSHWFESQKRQWQWQEGPPTYIQLVWTSTKCPMKQILLVTGQGTITRNIKTSRGKTHGASERVHLHSAAYRPGSVRRACPADDRSSIELSRVCGCELQSSSWDVHESMHGMWDYVYGGDNCVHMYNRSVRLLPPWVDICLSLCIHISMFLAYGSLLLEHISSHFTISA